VLVLVLGLAARAEDERSRRAREEVERQLAELVGRRPTRLRIAFQALDEPGYALREVAFELDDQPLAAPSLATLEDEGEHLIWAGDAAPGKHRFRARAVYQNQASIVVSDEGGYAWKVSGEVSFELQPGLEVQVRVVPVRDRSQREIARRIRLSFPAQAQMLSRVDDGSLPEPLARAAVDSGASLAVEGPLPAASPVPMAVRPGPVPAPRLEPVASPRRPRLEPQASPLEAPEALPTTRPPPESPTEPVAVGVATPWALVGGIAAGVGVVVGVVLVTRRRMRP
jgi:hypothetical protein